MAGIFDEEKMRQALERYIPDGETLQAGIHGVSMDTCIQAVFSKCAYTEDRVLPDEEGDAISVSKKKRSPYDIYIGITQSFWVITECETTQYRYEFHAEPEGSKVDAPTITSEIMLSDLGTCYPLADIRSCEIKKGLMGSVNCVLTMKNGSYFKLMFPKRGGVGGGMPHYKEYREAIVARLSGGNG